MVHRLSSRIARWSGAAVVVAFALLGTSLGAQLSVAAGAFGTLTRFDRALAVEDHTGVGGRVAIAWEGAPVQLEGEIAWTGTRSETSDASYVPLRLRLVHGIARRGGTVLIVGAGGVWSRYRHGSELATDPGVTALVALALPLPRRSAVRLDLVVDRVANEAARGRSAIWNPALSAGVMLPLGGGRTGPKADLTAVPTALTLPPPADRDRDGVSDSRDRCAGTPARTLVAADGCPYPAQWRARTP